MPWIGRSTDVQELALRVHYVKNDAEQGWISLRPCLNIYDQYQLNKPCSTISGCFDSAARQVCNIKYVTHLLYSCHWFIAALLSGLPQTVQTLDLGLFETTISGSSIRHFAALRNLVKLDLSHSCMGE